MGIEIEFDDEGTISKEIEFDSPIKRSLSYGLTKQPDQHSRIVSLAEREKLPVDMVERHLPELQSRESKAAINMDSIEFDTPVTAKALVDPDTAAMSHDDLDNLSALERIYRRQNEGSFSDRLSAGVRKANLGMVQTQRVYEYGLASLQPPEPSKRAVERQKLGRRILGALGLSDLMDAPDKYVQLETERRAAASSKAEAGLMAVAEVVKDLPEDPKIAEFSALVEATKENKGTAAATAAGALFLAKNPDMFAVLLAEQASPLALVAGGAGGFVGKGVGAKLAEKIASEALQKYVKSSVTMAGVQLSSNASLMYGQEITEGLNQGMTVDDAISRAGKKTLAESLTNAGFAFVPTFGGRFAKVAQETGKQGAAGATGAAVGAYAVGEDITLTELLLEGFGEFVSAPVDIAMAGAANRQDRVNADAFADAKEKAVLFGSSIDQLKLDELVAVTKANKLGDRNSERFTKFMQSVVETYGEDAQVFIDGEEVATIIDDMDSSLEGVQEMQRQLDQGGDIAIPLSSYIADIARSSAGDKIRPHVRLDIDGLSQVELEEAVPLMEQRVKEIIEKADLEAAEVTRVDEITEDIFDQLMATGRVSPQIAKMSSQIIPAYVATKAQEYGLTVDEMYSRVGFGGVKGPDTAAAPVDEGVQLEQAKQEGYEGESKGEAAEWVAAKAKGLDMSTEARMDRAREMGFDTDVVYNHESVSAELISKIEGDKGRFGGIFTLEDDLAGYFDNVQSFYIRGDIFEDSDIELAIEENFNESEGIVVELFGDVDVGEYLAYISSFENIPYDVVESSYAELQKARGKIALLGGASAVRQPDEFGDSVMLLPGAGIRSINAAFDPDFSESANLLAQRQVEIGFNEAAPPTKEEAHEDAEGEAGKTVNSLRRVGGSILANSMSADYKKKRSTSIIGQKAVTINDIAIAAQVYRNPSFETLRYFFVKNNVVVGQTGVTSRMPGETMIFPSSESAVVGLNKLRLQMKSLDADGYYMMHNHPSGNINPSKADLSSTNFIAGSLDGFLGHVVVNETEYASISPGGIVDVLPIAKLNPEYDLSKPAKSGAMLGKKVTGPDVFALAGTEYYRKDWIILVGRKGTTGEISGIAEFPKESLLLPAAQLQASLRDFMRQTGSKDVAMVNVPSEMMTGGSAVEDGVKNDLLLDAISESGVSLRSLGISPDQSAKPKAFKALVEKDGKLFQPKQDAANGDSQQALATFNIETRVITLLEQSNPTSFIHESGHLFLEMEKQLSAEFGVTERQKAMLDWLGVESFDQIEVEHHEKFARGFETYAFEGKAPSRDLAAVFASFRRWMLEVYKRISRLKAPLTPEVRDFFDHMLATDQQIEEVRSNPAYDQFFRDAKSAGMTAEEWDAYVKRQEASKNKSTSTLEEKILKQLKRTYTKEWKAEEAEMTEQVRAELLNQDVYRTVSFLRGELKIDDIEGNKLDRAKVDEILGLVPEKKVKEKGVNNEVDSLLIAIAKLGGLDRDDAMAEGIDSANWKGSSAKTINTPVFGKPIFKINGLSFDHMLEKLGEEGYRFGQIRDLLNAVDDELAGRMHYSDNADYNLIFDAADDQVAKKLPLPRVLWGASKKGGLDPDEVALGMGYSSGHEMLTDIINTPEMHDVARGIVQQRMINKHGDILNDGTIEQEARDAAQNEEKAKALMLELRALNKKAGADQDIDRAALKAGAVKTIAEARVSDIKPGRFYRAEIKSAQKSAKALEAGNNEEARNQKIQQLANHYLYREATEAQKRVTTMRRYIAGVKTRKINAKQVDPEYIHQMKLLAAAYEFRTGKPAENEAKSALLSLAGWVEAQMGSDNWIVPQFMDPTLSEMVAIKNNDALEAHEKSALIEQMIIPRYDEMTLEQLRGAYDMIKNLRYVGGRLSKGEAEAFKQLTEDTADSIIEFGGENIPRPQEQSTAYRVISAIKQFGAEHVVLGNAIAQLDGYQKFGPMFQAFYQQILDSTNSELKLKRDVHDKLEGIFGKFKRKDLAKGFKESGHAGHRQITKTNGERWSLSRRGRLMLAMYWGSPESRAALMQGNEISETDAIEMISTLSSKELDFVQEIWDLNEGLWPQVRDTALKMSGVAPPKVEHVPYEVNGRKMPGGYIRLFYDYDARDSYLADAGKNGSLTRSGGHVMKNTRHGSRNERVGSGGRPVSFELDNIFRALDENIHDIAFAETARDGTRFLQSKAIRNAIVLKYGKEVYESLTASMEGIIAGNFASNHPINTLLRYLRTNASYSFLGYSLRNLVQQPVAVTNVFGKIGEKYTLKGMAEFVFNPMKAKARVKWIQERSEFMMERTSLVNRETAEISNRIESGLLSGPLKRHAFDLQTMGDAMIAYPAWYGAYLQELDRTGNEKQAATYADEITAQTIGSGLMKDLSPMMQGSGQLKVVGPEMLKSITFMGSFFSKVANLTRDAYKENDLTTVRGTAEFTRQMSWYLMVPATVSAMIVDDLPGEDDDEGWLKWAGENILEYGLAQIFIMRDLVYLWNGFTPSTPYTRAVSEAGRMVKLTGDIAAGDKEVDAEVVAKLTRGVSAFVPLPGAGQAARGIEGAVDAAENNNRNLYQMLVEGKERN